MPSKHNKIISFTNIVFIFILISQVTYAQYSPIKGIVTDVENHPLEFASVALLKPADSVMVSFAITDNQGQFEITDAPDGDFILQIYLTSFLPYYKNITYKNSLIDLKNIQLNTNIQQLNEVTITAVVPVLIKNDTIAYNANSFKIQHDDTIEDLLKKLPGIELDNDGAIKSQGNEITKIYVDGKEFFSGDPAIVLKNLSADAINKIEVIDKKSDEYELTGVSDGQKTYVINLTLKKDRKNNGFGKVSAGLGLDNRYFSNVNLNKFSEKVQWSVIGKYNNINLSGSNIQDFLSFTGGLSDENDEEESSSTEKKNKGVSGYLTTAVGGANFGYELKKKEVVNVDYFYNHSENSGTSLAKQTSYSRLNNYVSEFDDDQESSSKTHNLNFNYEDKSSKISRLLIKGKLSSNNRISNINRDASYFNEYYEERTHNNIHYLNNNNRKNGNVRLDYFRKLNKNRRNFGISVSLLSYEISNQKEQNSLNTNLINNRTTKIFNLKDELLKNTNFNFIFKYAEPLGNNHFLKLQSTLLLKNGDEKVNQIKQRNEDKEQPLSYSITSKEYQYNTSLLYNYSHPIFNVNMGAELVDLNRNFGLTKENRYLKNQVYLNPKLSLRYKPKKGKNYSFNYRRSIRSPRNSMSAPVLDDSNPYYIKIGNPELLTEKIDNINVLTSSHNYTSNISIYSNITYQHIKNPIISSLSIDDNFIKTRSFVNQGSQNKINAEFNIDKRLKNIGLKYNFKTTGTYMASNSIIDFELNDVTSREYLIGLSLENDNKNSYDLKVGANYSANRTDFSVLQDLNREYIKQHYYTKFDYDITKRFNLNTQFDYFIYTDSGFDTNQKIPSWNASMSYAFSKNKKTVLKLLIIDLLDKNVDIERKSNINYFEETTNKTLGRYIILSFTYRLSGR